MCCASAVKRFDHARTSKIALHKFTGRQVVGVESCDVADTLPVVLQRSDYGLTDEGALGYLAVGGQQDSRYNKITGLFRFGRDGRSRERAEFGAELVGPLRPA